jgi:hypothetical protein
MNSEKNLERYVSVYQNKNSVDVPINVVLTNVLNWIKLGRWAKLIQTIRETGVGKGDLPCVTWTGVFNKGSRTENGISEFSGFAPMDFDMKDSSVDDIQAQIEELKEDPHIYAIWKSASGKGIHALMRIHSCESYRDHYRAIIKNYPRIDEKCSNISRILFVSHDPELYINEDALEFTEVITEEVLTLTSEPTKASKTDFRKLELVCNLFLNAQQGERNDKMLRAGRLLGGFISGGIIQEDIGRSALLGALEHRRYELGEEDYRDAIRTMENGITHGKLSPIHEIQDEFLKISLAEAIKEEDILKFTQSEQEGLDFLLKYKRGEFEKGLETGYTEFDPHFKFIKKALTVVLGHGHSGKTSFALWFCIIAAKSHGWKWAIYCGENSTESVRLILNQYNMGKRIEDATELEIERSNRWVSNKFVILRNEDLLEPVQVLDLMDKVRSVYSIDACLVDPFNYLKLPGKERYNSVIEAYTLFRNYCLRTGINLWLTAHTNTEAQREDKMPTAAQAEMGAMLFNKADQFICVHRTTWEDDDHTIRNNGCQVYIAKTDRDQLYGLVKGKYKEPIELRYTRIGFTDKHGLFPYSTHNAHQKKLDF